MTKCKKCGAPIVWIRSKDRQWIPCEAWTVEYHKGSTPDFEDRVVTEDGKVVQCTFDFQCDPDGVGRIPHWRDCPYSDEFRRS